MPSAKVIIATHKRYQMPKDPLYLPLHVGAAGKTDESGVPLDLGYQRDDEGENISGKNAQYCELTGLYWAWKHLTEDYIGLAHYRRQFGSGKKGAGPMQCVLTARDLAPLLGTFDIFVPKKRHYYIETLYSHYAHTHYASHLDAARNVIARRDPLILPAYDRVLASRSGYMFNMMIMRRELLDAYCGWLFPILAELEQEIDVAELSGFQARLFGRLSEILFNVWLAGGIESGAVKPDRIRELPVVYMEKVDWVKKGTAFLKAKFTHSKYEGSF